MDAVLWWLIPLIATTAAIGWIAWVRRPKPPADANDTVAEHRRFREALGQGRPPVTGPADQEPDTKGKPEAAS